MNALLGSMSLKEKIQVVLNQNGHFRCPNGSQRSAAKGSRASATEGTAEDRYSEVVANLRQRGVSKPKTVKTLMGTIRTLFPKNITEKELSTLVRQLEVKGVIRIEGAKVSYV